MILLFTIPNAVGGNGLLGVFSLAFFYTKRRFTSYQFIRASNVAYCELH